MCKARVGDYYSLTPDLGYKEQKLIIYSSSEVSFKEKMSLK